MFSIKLEFILGYDLLKDTECIMLQQDAICRKRKWLNCGYDWNVEEEKQNSA